MEGREGHAIVPSNICLSPLLFEGGGRRAGGWLSAATSEENAGGIMVRFHC